MLLNRASVLAAFGIFSGLAYAQFPPALEGITVLDSHIEDGIRISYKEVTICPHLHQKISANWRRERPL